MQRTVSSNMRVWTPDKKMVRRFERRLVEHLGRLGNSPVLASFASQHLAQLPSKKRQYVGLVDAKTGQRILEVGIYSDIQPNYWWSSRYPGLIADGGDDICCARFDPDSDVVLTFGCNGK
jgi:hypothetical protein